MITWDGKLAPVIGPQGKILKRSDLPVPDTKRWVMRRKAEIIAAIRGGLLSESTALDRYRLSAEELRSWRHILELHGVPGLRTTRVRTYMDRNTKTLLMRGSEDSSTADTLTSIEFGELKIDLEKKTLEIRGLAVPLTGKEYETLELLCLRRGTIVTKEAFLLYFYKGDIGREAVSKIVDVLICRLRKKMVLASVGKDYIETVWGRGYRIS